MSFIHLVQKNSAGKIKYMTLTLDGITVKKEYGLLGGKSQTAVATYKTKNAGKANESTPEQSAKDAWDRDIAKKMKEGYIATDSLSEIPDFPDLLESLDLSAIPKEFCLSKPIKEVSEKAVDALIAAGNAKFFAKYNGGCHYVLRLPDDDVRIYTRRWDDHTAKYPEIAAEALRTMSPNSLIAVELCIDPLLDLDHMEAFTLFAEISKTDTLNGACKSSQAASLALQKIRKVRAAVFGYLYCNGVMLWSDPSGSMLDEIEADFQPIEAETLLFVPQEADISSGAEAMDVVRQFHQKLEGLVMWDITKPMEVTMNGKPSRRAAYKIKPKFEMEVVAYGGIEGKTPGKYGSIAICLADAEGEEVDMGSVSGLKEAEMDPGYWDFPCVIEVTYENRFKDTGLLQFGNFSKIHLEKTIDEVEIFKLP